jgi:hypothetical protein
MLDKIINKLLPINNNKILSSILLKPVLKKQSSNASTSSNESKNSSSTRSATPTLSRQNGKRVQHNDHLSAPKKITNARVTVGNILSKKFNTVTKDAVDIHINSIRSKNIKDIASQEGYTSHIELGKIAKLAYFSSNEIELSQKTSDGFSNKLEENLIKEQKPQKNNIFNFQTDAKKLKNTTKKFEKIKNKAELVGEYYKDIKGQGIKLLTNDYLNPSEQSEPTLEDLVHKAGHALQTKIGSRKNGLQALLLKNTNNNEIIIAFRGTDEKKDISTDLNLGKDQFNSIKRELSDYIGAVKNASPDAKITFTGHSLGGGLSEIAGYFAKKENPDTPVSVVSFNGFGAKATIDDFENTALVPQNISIDTVNAINSTHYRTAKDPVSPIGVHITKNNIKLNDDTKKNLVSHQMNVINHFFNPSF